MKVVVGRWSAPLAPATESLLRRMAGSLSGLTPDLAFVMRSALDPAVTLAVAEIAAPDNPRGRGSIWAGTHHIAGIGTTRDDAITRCLAESLERYAHYIWPAGNPHKIITASYRSMHAHSRVLMPEGLQYFSELQAARGGFPFSRLQPDQPIGWVAAHSLIHEAVRWLPAQIALVGYVRQAGEPRIALGVTSGTAAHITFYEALRNALLELIQTDTAMGNWYGSRPAILVRHDRRTDSVRELMERYLHRYGPVPRFYWLPNVDLPGLTVACVLENQETPKSAVGLGSDLRLSHAMFKAFLEAIAVSQLAKANLLRMASQRHADSDPAQIYDFDSNVVFYATSNRPAFAAKFGAGPSVNASDLPADLNFDVRRVVHHLIAGFRDTGKELVFLDLTAGDIRDLGFRVARVWSPDTIHLCLPSAPPAMNPRFEAYGGVANESPHPYP